MTAVDAHRSDMANEQGESQRCVERAESVLQHSVHLGACCDLASVIAVALGT